MDVRWKVLKDDLTICHSNIADGTTIFTSPALDGGGGTEPNNVQIRDALCDVLKKDGDKFNLMIEGLTTRFQKRDLKVFKIMAEDQKLQARNIFNYAREVDKTIAFSTWYRKDQTIKPK